MVTIFGGWAEVDEEIEEVDTCGSGDGVTTGIVEEVADVLGKLDVLRRCCVQTFCHFWWLNAYCVCVTLTDGREIFHGANLKFPPLTLGNIKLILVDGYDVEGKSSIH
jgi:hypothetical protein